MQFCLYQDNSFFFLLLSLFARDSVNLFKAPTQGGFEHRDQWNMHRQESVPEN